MLLHQVSAAIMECNVIYVALLSAVPTLQRIWTVRLNRELGLVSVCESPRLSFQNQSLDALTSFSSRYHGGSPNCDVDNLNVEWCIYAEH